MSASPNVIRQRLLARVRLRHWFGFVTVADLGSVRKAAEQVGLAQPALTSLLQDLETLLGAPLFERHARGMRLTPLGQELLPTARRMLSTLDDAAEQAAALQTQTQGVVRVGAIAGAVSGLLTQALPVLAQRHPELLVQLMEVDALQLNQLVTRGDIDMALCRAPRLVPQDWVFEPLLRDHWAIVAAPSHPLAAHRRLSRAQLCRQTWLVPPSGSAAQVAFDALFRGQTPGPSLCQISSRSPAVLWAMLEAQPLLALVPASVAHQLIAAGRLVELHVNRALPFEPIGALVAQRERRGSVEALLKVLRGVQKSAGGRHLRQ